MPVLSSSRTVLILKDEGLQIFYANKFAAKYIDLIPWETDEFTVAVSDIIVDKCRRSPVIIINDMVEQHYRKERIPKVSIVDRQNVLKRRLSVSFPNYKIRAALKLNGESKAAEKGSGGNYLFAAIAMSDQISKTLASVQSSMTRIVGVYLLPIEAADMVKTLSSKIRERGAGVSQWAAFIGQHENGGLRQVVTRNGNLALTRMTPIIDTDVEPDLWAKEVVSELLATMSYLTRLGYKEGDGLDIIIAANESAKEPLNQLVNIDCKLEVLNIQELSSLLGVTLSNQKDDRYADHLYAAYFAKKVKLRLPLHIKNLNGFILPRRAATFMLVLLAGAIAYFGYSTFQKWQETYVVNEKNTLSTQTLNANRSEYRRLLMEEKRLGYDLLFVNNSTEVYKSIENKKVLPTKVLSRIAKAMGPDLRLDEIKILRNEVAKEEEEGVLPVMDIFSSQSFDPNEEVKEYTGSPDGMDAVLSAALFISFPNTINLEEGVARINKFKDNLQSELPDYKVSVARQIADLSYTGNFVGDTAGEANKPEEYIAEISITRTFE